MKKILFESLPNFVYKNRTAILLVAVFACLLIFCGLYLTDYIALLNTWFPSPNGSTPNIPSDADKFIRSSKIFQQFGLFFIVTLFFIAIQNAIFKELKEDEEEKRKQHNAILAIWASIFVWLILMIISNISGEDSEQWQNTHKWIVFSTHLISTANNWAILFAIARISFQSQETPKFPYQKIQAFLSNKNISIASVTIALLLLFSPLLREPLKNGDYDLNILIDGSYSSITLLILTVFLFNLFMRRNLKMLGYLQMIIIPLFMSHQFRELSWLEESATAFIFFRLIVYIWQPAYPILMVFWAVSWWKERWEIVNKELASKQKELERKQDAIIALLKQFAATEPNLLIDVCNNALSALGYNEGLFFIYKKRGDEIQRDCIFLDGKKIPAKRSAQIPQNWENVEEDSKTFSVFVFMQKQALFFQTGKEREAIIQAYGLNKSAIEKNTPQKPYSVFIPMQKEKEIMGVFSVQQTKEITENDFVFFNQMANILADVIDIRMEVNEFMSEVQQFDNALVLHFPANVTIKPKHYRTLSIFLQRTVNTPFDAIALKENTPYYQGNCNIINESLKDINEGRLSLISILLCLMAAFERVNVMGKNPFEEALLTFINAHIAHKERLNNIPQADKNLLNQQKILVKSFETFARNSHSLLEPYFASNMPKPNALQSLIEVGELIFQFVKALGINKRSGKNNIDGVKMLHAKISPAPAPFQNYAKAIVLKFDFQDATQAHDLHTKITESFSLSPDNITGDATNAILKLYQKLTDKHFQHEYTIGETYICFYCILS